MSGEITNERGWRYEFFSLGERALGAVRRVTIRLQVLGRPPELSKGGKNQV
jgi:hypothetical protein